MPCFVFSAQPFIRDGVKDTMYITIDDIRHAGHVTSIDFSSTCGTATASWAGALPDVGERHNVELELNDVFVWDDNIALTDKCEPSIHTNGELFELVGLIVSVDDDGCFTIDVDGSIVFLDVEAAPKNLKGFVKCLAVDVRLYPTGL